MNVYSKFKKLLRKEGKRTAVVQAPYANKTIKIKYPNGKQTIIEGEGFKRGDTVIIEDGKVVGGAPTLDTYEVEV
jgi:hypothetical protein